VASDESKAFLGQGWAFPVRLQTEGRVALSRYEDDVREAILLILETNHGERMMRPEFGANLRDFLFRPMNTTTMAMVRHRVEEALITWEPRIDRVEVSNVPGTEPGRLDIEIRYRVRRTNIFYNLVYPFYLMEGKET